MNRLAILLFILTCSACSAAPNYRNVSTITQSDKPVIASLADELRQEHEAGTFDGVILVAVSLVQRIPMRLVIEIQAILKSLNNLP